MYVPGFRSSTQQLVVLWICQPPRAIHQALIWQTEDWQGWWVRSSKVPHKFDPNKTILCVAHFTDKAIMNFVPRQDATFTKHLLDDVDLYGDWSLFFSIINAETSGEYELTVTEGIETSHTESFGAALEQTWSVGTGVEVKLEYWVISMVAVLQIFFCFHSLKISYFW